MKIMEIQEKFATFLDLQPLTGESIARKTLDLYDELGINPKQYRCQSYGGAQNTQSEKKEVASLILKKLENAVVTHCCMHNLKFSVSTSARIQIIDNSIESYKKTTFFSKLSP